MNAYYGYFIWTEEGKNTYHEAVDKIRKSLKKYGAHLCADDLDSQPWKRMQKGITYSLEEHLRIIDKADVCVFEYSVKSGAFGYQLAHVVETEKPVLVLYKKGVHPVNFFLHNINYPLMTIYEYDDTSEIEGQIEKFIDNYKDHEKTRYNLVINKKLDQYLEWAAFQYKKSKTEVIQDAIEEYDV